MREGVHQWLRYAYRKFRRVPGIEPFAEWLKRPYIGGDGRVRFHKLGLDVCEVCNLRCEHCTHFSPFRTALHSKEELMDSLTRWGGRIVPRELSILGGEPFMHPDLGEIVVAARKSFFASRIVLTTNGTLLSKADDRLLRTLAKSRVSLHISVHLDTKEYQDDLAVAIQKLQQFRIKHHIESYTAPGSWYMIYGLNSKGVPIPYDSNPLQAWNVCFRRDCGKIIGDQLYRCGTLGNIVRAYHEGAIGSEWSRALTHQPATLDSTPQEILEYIRGGGMPECSVCPETIGAVASRQLSFEDVKQIKAHIREEREKKN